jgi:hypothetical protein
MGLTDEPPDDLDLMAAQQYAASAGGGGGSNNISCANKNALKTKAEKAGLTSAVAAAGVGIAGITSAFFGPPGIAVAATLGIASTALGFFSAGFYQLASSIGGMSCT